MSCQTRAPRSPIHRHTGGLENTREVTQGNITIHRHTGGLEIGASAQEQRFVIHRHTGGLEIAARHIFHH